MTKIFLFFLAVSSAVDNISPVVECIVDQFCDCLNNTCGETCKTEIVFLRWIACMNTCKYTCDFPICGELDRESDNDEIEKFEVASFSSLSRIPSLNFDKIYSQQQQECLTQVGLYFVKLSEVNLIFSK
jgi:hypothetical protein